MPYTLGATNVTILDRPRTVETAKITHLMRGLSGPSASDGLKLALYGEAHQMAAGVRRDVALESQIPPAPGPRLAPRLAGRLFTGVRNTYAAFFFAMPAGSPSTTRFRRPPHSPTTRRPKEPTRRSSPWRATSKSPRSASCGAATCASFAARLSRRRRSIATTKGFSSSGRNGT